VPGRAHVEITDAPPSLDAARRFVADPSHGGFTFFAGVVRDHNLGRDVVAVSYDVFEPLALATLRAICARTQGAHGPCHVYVAHARGRIAVGEPSVVIAASTPHRAESFAACRAVIEALKHEAPIWKQEHYVDGDSAWVKGHSLCRHEEHGR
jgi:molybdopterin synthase catalytic subunit